MTALDFPFLASTDRHGFRGVWRVLDRNQDEEAALTHDQGDGPQSHWTVEEAEGLLRRLEGVISARIITDRKGQVEEVHLLTSAAVQPKKTVRNVESALRAHFDLTVDHRKVSVAQTRAQPDYPKPAQPTATGEKKPTPPPPVASEPVHGVNQGVIESPWGDPSSDSTAGPRLVFVRHRQDRARSKKLRMTVELEWAGNRYKASADALDLPRQRLEATAEATLGAVRQFLAGTGARISLDLDGVEVVQALDHRYALVSVHGLVDGRFSPLTGVVSMSDDPEQAVILATLRATERPVRIILSALLEGAGEDGEDRSSPGDGPRGDPLRLWGGGS